MKPSKKTFLSLILTCVMATFFMGCRHDRETESTESITRYAENLVITEFPGYDDVRILNKDGREVARYILTDTLSSFPQSITEGAEEIKVPLQNFIIDSEVYAGVLEELGRAETIRGMFDGAYITSQELKKGVESGKIKDLGPTSNPNLETLLSLQPDAMVISYFDGMKARNLDGIGVPVIKMYDLQESTPLGRAEWIRFIGRLVGKREEADSIFAAVEEEYMRIKNDSLPSSRRPKVLTELMYDGVWYVPGGDSYQATLINDAGGNYFKSDDSSAVTLSLSAEEVINSGADADIWLIKHYGDEMELKGILETDPVYRELSPYSTGRIYYSDTSKSGIFREGPFHPEKILHDYKIIFSGDTVGKPRYFINLKQ